MKGWRLALAAAVTACATAVPAARAQTRAGGGSVPADTAAQSAPAALRPIRLAKWGTLAAATAAGVLGFVENARADDRYAELERMCEAQPSECRRRTADGAYESEAFESVYQQVRRHDHRAHTALVAGQIGVAASVVLFLLDLGNVRPPGDIPWVPGTLRMAGDADGFSLGIHLPLARERR